MIEQGVGVRLISVKYDKVSHSVEAHYAIGQWESTLKCKLPPVYMSFDALDDFIFRGMMFVYGHKVEMAVSPEAHQQMLDIVGSTDFIRRTLLNDD